MRLTFLVFILSASVCSAHGELIGVGGLPYPAPTTLGPYDMTLFPLDPQPLLEDVTSVASPLGGDVAFSDPVLHLRAGVTWGLWWTPTLSPDMYYKYPPGELTLFLPPGTVAFDFWARTDHDGWPVVATADGTSSVVGYPYFMQPVYYGFYATEAGETIESITLVSYYTEVANLVVGHFQIAIPEPASSLLFLVAAAAAPRVRRWPA